MKKSKKPGTKKKHLSKVTTEDFFSQDFENDLNSDDNEKGKNT